MYIIKLVKNNRYWDPKTKTHLTNSKKTRKFTDEELEELDMSNIDYALNVGIIEKIEDTKEEVEPESKEPADDDVDIDNIKEVDASEIEEDEEEDEEKNEEKTDEEKIEEMKAIKEDDGVDVDELTVEDIEEMSYNDMRSLCSDLDLGGKGTSEELEEKLLDYIA